MYQNGLQTKEDKQIETTGVLLLEDPIDTFEESASSIASAFFIGLNNIDWLSRLHRKKAKSERNFIH